jgi:uncharacterized protein
MRKLILLGLILLLPAIAFSGIPVGEKPKTVVLEGEVGGRLDGTKWSSDEIREVIYMLFYVDPDEKEINDHMSKRLKEEKFPRDKVKSIAIINMDATWAPNFAIQSSLEEKQKEFPHTLYLKDYEKYLVKEWNLGDDTYDVHVFDPSGTVVFSKEGKLTEAELNLMIQTIRDLL